MQLTPSNAHAEVWPALAWPEFEKLVQALPSQA
jgi:hypothetical protein